MNTTVKKYNISNKQSFCVGMATKVLGDKWTPKLIVNLLEGPLHFCELQSSTVGINPRTLTLRLNKLVSLGIVNKEVSEESIHKTSYTLTKMGHDLLPILQSMVDWGYKYSPIK